MAEMPVSPPVMPDLGDRIDVGCCRRSKLRFMGFGHAPRYRFSAATRKGHSRGSYGLPMSSRTISAVTAPTSIRADALDRIRLPGARRTPLGQILRRIGAAMALVVFVALVVLLGRDGYVDSTGDPISFLDALYYASVTVTTTGYGDITAISPGARLAATILILPARILFLILVVGTTVEVLTDQSRQLLLSSRWRKNVTDHYLICGYGSTGQAVVRDLIDRGVSADEIVVVDISAESMAAADEHGVVGIHGDASLTSVLRQAGIESARAVVVVPNRDDTAVLVTLTARELRPDVHIVAGGREQENLHLLRQGGANEVIDATAAVGRMLGLGTCAPAAVQVLDDILDAGTGLELAEIGPDIDGGQVQAPSDVTIVAVLRDSVRLRPDEVDLGWLQPTDRLVVLRENEGRSA